jgi:pimeloyl-ACP methyl ester carboxylesterase
MLRSAGRRFVDALQLFSHLANVGDARSLVIQLGAAGGKAFDAALPTVVLIHGAQNEHSVWALQSRYMAHHGLGLLAPGLPGHGRSKGAALQSVGAIAQAKISRSRPASP